VHSLLLASAPSAVPVHLVSKAGWPALIERLAPEAARFAKAHGFAARPGQHVVLPDGLGAVSAVLLGVEGASARRRDPFAPGRLAAVLRPIRNDIPSLTQLGLPAELLQSWMQRRQGLILITGPTGSGKSTTVASSLNWINQQLPRHIVTLEDPIEFLFTNDQCMFSQREIRQDSESFASGLRSALRQSPDILFLGEIRDQETAVTALQSAATGHLVISTLHSSSVVETLDRFSHLLKAGTEEALHLLAGQLIGIFSQQLLPRSGGGLFLALEYMQNEAATRRWILENRLTEIQDHLLKSGGASNCSLLQYLVASVQQGYVEADVARSACARPQDFDRAMRGIS